MKITGIKLIVIMRTIKYNLNIDKLEITYLLTTDFSNMITEQLESYYDRLDDKDNLLIDYIDFKLTIPKEKLYLHYKYEFDIEIKDYNKDKGIYFRRLGKIFFDSNNPIRQQLYVMIDNYALYNRDFLHLHFIEDVLGLQFMSISKLDLALDLNINFITKFYRILKDKSYTPIILNKQYKDMDKIIKEMITISQGTRVNPTKYKSFYFSNKEKGLELACYNKLKEIEDNNNSKQYILDKLQFKPIYRMEIRTNHKILADSMKKLNIDDNDLFYNILFNEEILFKLYLTLLDRLIRFRYQNQTYNLLEVIF